MKTFNRFVQETSMALLVIASITPLAPLAQAKGTIAPDYVEVIDCPVAGEIEGRPGYGVFMDRNSGQIVAITNHGGFTGGSKSTVVTLGMTRNSQGSCLVQIEDGGSTPSYYHVRAKQIHLGGRWRACRINEFYDEYFNRMCQQHPANPEPQPQPHPQPQPQPRPGVQGDQPATVLCGSELDRYELMSAYKSGVSSYNLQFSYDKVMARICPRQYASGPTAADNRNDCRTESGRYARVSQYRGAVPRCGRECAHDYVLAQVCPNYNEMKGGSQAPAKTERRWWQGDTSELSNLHFGVR